MPRIRLVGPRARSARRHRNDQYAGRHSVRQQRDSNWAVWALLVQCRHRQSDGKHNTVQNPIWLVLESAELSALIGSGAMLRIGCKPARRPTIAAIAANIDHALEKVLTDPAKRTKDLGGPLGTQALARGLAANDNLLWRYTVRNSRERTEKSIKAGFR